MQAMGLSLKTVRAPRLWIISLALVFALFIVRDLTRKEGEREDVTEAIEPSDVNTSISIFWKLLQLSEKNQTDRLGTACSKNDLEVNQEKVSPLPNGIPVYLVKILNICSSNCRISKILLHCGWFSSATLINPKVFRRVHYDACLFNDGHSIGPGRTIFFQYSNTF